MKKLTPEQVAEIRRLGAPGLTTRELAKRFGVSHATIARVLREVGWTRKKGERRG